MGLWGVYVYDLATGETISYNADTVFSGASVMKVPILLQAYANLPELTEKQRFWARTMILESDNLNANALLAASVGGAGTEDALVAVQQMTASLQQLGLQHTYQNLPYEAYEYLVLLNGYEIPSGPPQEGTPPYTEADPLVRTTPAEIGSLFVMLDQCSTGEGPLLELFSENLTEQRCQEMLDLLAENPDDIRMRSGLPTAARVEHKAGWVEDMQADVGIVRSPGGDFVLAVYLYQETDWLRDHIAGPVLGDFARLVYSAYNPIPLVETTQE
ncbi:MAG: serine hydrolase [Chloroflexaceae bacterium]|nr:serine hydrolase [Chloroflexaceae bacterium]